ncbi:hypothetical protein FJ250_00295 [bacterium]|nr:hypothetical protein [bacterium]
MTPEPTGPGPDDVAVVMCRGESRRFGAPKALAIVDGDPRPLLLRVAAGYRRGGVGLLLVVTTPALAPDCLGCLTDAALPPLAVATGPAGGGTARTLALAWTWLAAAGRRPARLWVQPVDLPHARRRTLMQLALVADANPGRIVRPTWGGQPGHPLVLPFALLTGLAPAAADAPGSWQDFYADEVAAGRAPAPVPVPVADPGVVLDHDEPAGPHPAGGKD